MKLKLKSKKLILRPPKLSDAPILEKYINDKLVCRYLTLSYPYPKGGYKKWILKTLRKLKKKEGYAFIILLNDNPIGSIDLNRVDWKNKKATVGYWLARKYWGQGIMVEAMKMVLNFGFNQLKLHRIESSHFKENHRSGRVQEKCGLKKEGIKKDDIFKNNKFHDHICRAILVNEYKKLKKWNAQKL